MKISWIACLLVIVLFAHALGAEHNAFDLEKIDRTIAHEPEYTHQPHYALLVFGPEAEHRSWLVIDGQEVAYIDRNGNGDLTEPGERIELDVAATDKINVSGSGAYEAMNVFPLGEIAGHEFTFQLWVRNPDFVPQTDFDRKRIGERTAKQWENGTLLRKADDGSFAQNPLLLTATPQEAQISHFGGQLTFDLKWGDRQRLEPWPKKTLFDVHVGTRNFLAHDCEHRAFALSRLTMTEIPADLHPVAVFQFPARDAGQLPIERTVQLDQRCCGDTYYAELTLPRNAATGIAHVTVSLPHAGLYDVMPAEFQVPIPDDRSDRAERSFVMFGDSSIQLKDAVNALRKRGLDVQIHPQALAILRDGKPEIAVALARGEDVRSVAAALGENSDNEEFLSRCDARFEIAFFDTDDILKDDARLRAVESALQELTGGAIYQTWNGRLTGPNE